VGTLPTRPLPQFLSYASENRGGGAYSSLHACVAQIPTRWAMPYWRAGVQVQGDFRTRLSPRTMVYALSGSPWCWRNDAQLGAFVGRNGCGLSAAWQPHKPFCFSRNDRARKGPALQLSFTRRASVRHEKPNLTIRSRSGTPARAVETRLRWSVERIVSAGLSAAMDPRIRSNILRRLPDVCQFAQLDVAGL